MIWLRRTELLVCQSLYTSKLELEDVTLTGIHAEKKRSISSSPLDITLISKAHTRRSGFGVDLWRQHSEERYRPQR